MVYIMLLVQLGAWRPGPFAREKNTHQRLSHAHMLERQLPHKPGHGLPMHVGR